MQGIDDMPKADPDVRALIALQAQTKGWPAMHAELAKVDPITAARLQPQDSQRISRALEVFRLSGQPLAFFQTRNTAKDVANIHTNIDVNFRLISLEPLERSWLHARIAARFDAMLAAGFMDEVKALLARGDLHADLPSMRCVGYRQAWEALEGTSPMAELRDKGIFATRQLAKRQITWLRSMPERHVVACDAPDALEQVLALIEPVWA